MLIKSSRANSSPDVPSLCGSLTKRVDNSSPVQLNRVYKHILGMSLYRMCAAHLAHLEKTHLLPNYMAPHLRILYLNVFFLLQVWIGCETNHIYLPCISFMICQPLKHTQIILWCDIFVIIDAGPRNQLSLAAQVVFSAATGTEF